MQWRYHRSLNLIVDSQHDNQLLVEQIMVSLHGIKNRPSKTLFVILQIA